MTGVASEFNEGEKIEPADNGASQNLNSETSGMPAQVNFAGNGRSIEETVKDFFQKCVPGGEEQVNQQLKGAENNLKKQWNISDRLSNMVLHPKDTSKMSEKEKKEYKENLNLKLKIYDTLKLTRIINPYELEARWFVRKMKKQRGNLQNTYDSYNQELKGITKKTQDAGLYTKMFDVVPESFKQNPEYTNLLDLMKENGCMNNTGGLRTQKRELSEKGRSLSDYDDLVEVFISQIGKNLDQARADLEKVDAEMAKNPGNIAFMQEKTAKTAFYNKLESDLEYVQDHKEDISDNLMKVGTELQIVRRKAAKRAAVLLETKECINQLDAAISQVEDYISSGKDVVIMSDHLLNIDDAYNLVGRAGLIGAFGDKVAGMQLDALSKRGKEGVSLTDKSTNDWTGRENSIRAQQRERVAAYKAQLKPTLYSR